MFWDFKDRSLRTEQLLIELLKQLKNAEDVQCLVEVDTEGMIMQGYILIFYCCVGVIKFHMTRS